MKEPWGNKTLGKANNNERGRSSKLQGDTNSNVKKMAGG